LAASGRHPWDRLRVLWQKKKPTLFEDRAGEPATGTRLEGQKNGGRICFDGGDYSTVCKTATTVRQKKKKVPCPHGQAKRLRKTRHVSAQTSRGPLCENNDGQQPSRRPANLNARSKTRPHCPIAGKGQRGEFSHARKKRENGGHNKKTPKDATLSETWTVKAHPPVQGDGHKKTGLRGEHSWPA